MNAEKEQIAKGLAQCAREKYWSEKTADERIATLASDLAYAMVAINQLAERLEKFEQHSHGPSGALVIPYQSTNQGLSGGFSSRSYPQHIYERLGQREPR